MVKISSKKTPKFPSQKRNKICKLCKNNLQRYSSSSLGRHIRTMHVQKNKCSFCLKLYREKNNHRASLIKEKYFIKIFIDELDNNPSKKVPEYPSNISNNLSNIFSDTQNALLYKKLNLGQGHFSKVFFGIDKKTKLEMAIKIPKDNKNLLDYQKEANILNKLKGRNFLPIIYNYSNSSFFAQINMTLHGPNLLELYNFSNRFDKIPVIIIFENLLSKIKYMTSKNIIHRDIRPENIVWGLVNNSKRKK